MTRTVLVSLLLASLVACGPAPTELVIVAPVSSMDLEIVNDLSGLLDRNSDIHIRLTDERASGGAALDALTEGRADLALISNFQPYREEIATVLPFYPTVLHIAYREGKEVSDGYSMLRGGRVYAGEDGSASRQLFDRIASRLNLAQDEYSFVNPSDTPKDNGPDVLVVFAPISSAHDATLSNYRLFSLGSPSDIDKGSIADAAALIYPPLRPFVIPIGTYGNATPEPTLTVAVDKVLVARSDLDTTVVYDLIREILRLRPALSAQRPGLFDRLTDDFDVSSSTYVLHSGTQSFLRRAEPTIFERYAGIAEIAITLILASISAGVAGMRIFKMRRKNRIDRYYSAALEIQDSLGEFSGVGERSVVAGKIRELQSNAFAELIDERLTADESFRIFITLTNDILRQVRS